MNTAKAKVTRHEFLQKDATASNAIGIEAASFPILQDWKDIA